MWVPMKHYGDITKISGDCVPIVDVITGGSPCQDLSIAGKRAGLDGERSGLFMEQIRIVKEMRKRDRSENGRSGFLCRPRFMVWENVPGAFSSNGGRDFQAVLSEIVKIADEEAPDVPMPDKGGWAKAGCLLCRSQQGCPDHFEQNAKQASYQGTYTLSKVGEDKYNLLIQNHRGRVLVFRQGITFKEATEEMKRMEEANGISENPECV